MYIRPLGNTHCPAPATQKRRRPRDARPYIRPAKEAETKGRQGVHPIPWQCTLSHACHANKAETKGRQGVHPTPWRGTLSDACHAKEAEIKGRQGVHPTPWQCTLSHACHATEAETKGCQGVHPTPCLVLFNRFLVSLEGFDLELGLSCVVFFHVLSVIVLWGRGCFSLARFASWFYVSHGQLVALTHVPRFHPWHIKGERLCISAAKVLDMDGFEQGGWTPWLDCYCWQQRALWAYLIRRWGYRFLPKWPSSLKWHGSYIGII